MSIRCSGIASRSFIIGRRLWPPAITRASGPSRCSDAMAPSRLVARSYSNAAGVCKSRLLSGVPRGHALARLADVLTLLVLHRRVRPDHRRAWQALGARVADVRVEHLRRQAG